MTARTITPRLFVSGAALLMSSAAAFFASPANAIVAPTCNPGCVKGFHCEASQVQLPCPDIACAPDQKCPPSTCDTTTQTVFACVADPCTADTDCADGMVCATETETSCPPSAGAAEPCPPGADCKAAPPPPLPEPCTTTTTSMCKPKYMLPCKTADDCGAGFQCIEEQSCGCSGSGGAPAPTPGGAGGAADMPVPDPGFAPPPDCSCSGSGTFRCQAQLVPCNFNSDCPTNWMCKPVNTTSPGTDTPSSGSGSGTAGAANTGSGTAGAGNTANTGSAGTPNGAQAPADRIPAPGPTPTEMFCVPPYADNPGGGYDNGGTAKGGQASGDPTSPTPRPGGTGTGTGGTTGSVPPTASGATTGSSGEHSGTDATDTGSKTEGGCQVGSGSSTSSGAALLAVLGLAGLVRRRSRKVA